MRPEEVADRDGEDEPNDNVKLMKVVSQMFPLFAHPKPDVRQEIAPRQGSDKGEDDESWKVHLRDTGRKRNERAHHGKHSAEKDGRLSIFGKPAISDIEIMVRDQEIGAKAFRKWSPSPHSHVVGDNRAKYIADCTRQGHTPYRKLPGHHEVPGERHDDFARERDAGTLNRHREENPSIPKPRNAGDDESAQFTNNRLNQTSDHLPTALAERRKDGETAPLSVLRAITGSHALK